ncbi:ovochymase-1 [Stigmatopora nigra]
MALLVLLFLLPMGVHGSLGGVENSTVSPGDGPTPARNAPGLGNFSGGYELAGVRSFVAEQQAELRIVGGQEAWAHSWPWQVLLRFAGMPACGGTILSQFWVVSVAHCFKRFHRASFWTALAGKHNLDDPDEKGQQVVGVAAIVSHHRYNSGSKEFDVALLRLERALTFGSSVRPIHVWTTPLPTWEKCAVTGWGSTQENGPRVSRLQEVNVTVLTSDLCRRYYKRRIRARMFCAGQEEGGVDACQGDSGGPLSCYADGRFYLLGVVSWGVGCGQDRKPGVYTQLGPYAHWIADVIENQELGYADKPGEEDRCGKRRESNCRNPSAPAGLRVGEDGWVSVENVTEACPGAWPWQVSLQAYGLHYCSGVLLGRRWVLAARHCRVRAGEDVAVLGAHDMGLSLAQIVPVERVLEAPQEDGFPPKDDLALLHLAFPARLGSPSTQCVL